MRYGAGSTVHAGGSVTLTIGSASSDTDNVSGTIKTGQDISVVEGAGTLTLNSGSVLNAGGSVTLRVGAGGTVNIDGTIITGGTQVTVDGTAGATLHIDLSTAAFVPPAQGLKFNGSGTDTLDTVGGSTKNSYTVTESPGAPPVPGFVGKAEMLYNASTNSSGISKAKTLIDYDYAKLGTLEIDGAGTQNDVTFNVAAGPAATEATWTQVYFKSTGTDGLQVVAADTSDKTAADPSSSTFIAVGNYADKGARPRRLSSKRAPVTQSCPPCAAQRIHVQSLRSLQLFGGNLENAAAGANGTVLKTTRQMVAF